MDNGNLAQVWLRRATDEGITLFMHDGTLWIGNIPEFVSNARMERFRRDLDTEPGAREAVVAHLSGNVTEAL